MKTKCLNKIISLAAALLLTVAIIPAGAFAAESGDTVVVGVNPDYGLFQTAGQYTGFASDYLREISKRINRTFTFVEGTAPELAAKLASGEIDIIPCVSESELSAWESMTSAAGPEKPLDLTLSKLSLMMKFTGIYAPDNGSSSLNYNDYESLRSCRIGYLKEDYSKYFINGAFISANLRKAKFVGYDTEAQMKTDFESGKIDAVAKDCFRTWENESIVYQVASNDCYFMASSDNQKLLDELDGAVGSIYLTDSGFSSGLYEKYVARYGGPRYALTDSERHFIDRNPEITVAFNLQSSSMERYDSGSKTLVGPTASIMEKLSKISGLKFKFAAYDTLDECIDAMNNGQVQAVCGGVNTYSTEKYTDLRISAPYSKVPIATVGRNGSTVNSRSRIAIPSCSDDITQYICSTYPNAQVLHYDNEKECLNAILNGEADVVCSNAYELINILRTGYDEMKIIDVKSSFHYECLAFTSANEDLFHILGKSIACFSNNEAITESCLAISQIDSITSGNLFIERYLVWIIGGVLVILTAIFVVVCISSFRTRRINDIDPLTGGRSKKKFFEDSKKLLKKSNPDNWAIVLFDIDKFKYVNDRLGYDEGNKMLGRLYKTIEDHLENDEIFARISDDNFVLAIKNATDNELTSRINGIFEEFERRNSLFVKYTVVFSAGICRLNQCMHESRHGEVDINSAIDRCKIAKSTLKGTHYSSIAFYDGSIRDKALREKDYESMMPTALKRHEFLCYLQPKYGLRSRHIEGAEALIRWNSPELGFISPGEFIPIAEKNGFVVELDFFILEEVCRTMRHWLDQGKKPVVVSVNQSRLHLNYDDYIWRLREIVDKYEIPYEYIELELTESVFTENAEKLLKIMHKLHEIGFKLSLDDFGSGYSSLNMLKDIPVDVVKIDKEFFNDTMNTRKGRAVISTVVDLAKNLDMDVISEGVETREQVDFLTEIHCAMVQGYYFAKPMPITDFENLWFDDMEERLRQKEAAAAQQQQRLDTIEQQNGESASVNSSGTGNTDSLPKGSSIQPT